MIVMYILVVYDGHDGLFCFDIPECLILSSIAQYDCAIFYFPRLAPAFLCLHESDVLNICKS